MQNFDHNIGIWEKRQFFRRKLSKIAENRDHNIDSWFTEISQFVNFSQTYLNNGLIFSSV
jgi:hypothetical protein